MLTPWALVTATAGLIAFHIGVLTLVGRERKSPYVINSVFPIFLLSLLVAATSVTAAILPPAWGNVLLAVSGWVLVLAILFSIYQVYRIIVRFVYFVDSISPKHWPIVRPVRRRWSMRSPRPSYTHSTLRVPPKLQDEILATLRRYSDGSWTTYEEMDSRSLAVAIDYQSQSDRLLAELAVAFLREGFSVQYMAASRHPIEFVGFLKGFVERTGMNWQTVCKQVVTIDAYSPHFGFIDSVYALKARDLASLDVTCVRSKMTYAGMHSAASRAFQTIRAQMGRNYRQPTLVIYEGSYALVDLESPEQYRVFIRHVLPSERLWGGMFTIFVESGQAEADWNVLQGYASMKLDLRPLGQASKVRASLGEPDEGSTALRPEALGAESPPIRQSQVGHLGRE